MTQASYHIFLTADWVARGVSEHHLDWIAVFTSCIQNLCYFALCTSYLQRGMNAGLLSMSETDAFLMRMPLLSAGLHHDRPTIPT